jgi:alkanesulfonate monooxygenase SsuD/methylene tetrahydromethanopterin reductase-like flavin-dependent oxidoreductase (luciferase family)
MLEVAGELAAGTVTWMTGLDTLESHIVPSIRRAAAAAGRGAPRIQSAVPICLTDDVDAARDACNKSFAIYGKLPSYRAMLDREGAGLPGDVALLGDEAALRAGLARYRDVGVDDFAPSVFGVDGDAVSRTLAFLKSEVSAHTD